jgi:putative ABC transport system permease protein
MLKNYFTTAFRNLVRHKTSTVINVLGLAMGIATSLVLFLLIQHETSYDRFHSNFNRIYRVVFEADGNNGKNYSSGVPPVLWEAFKNDFPEAEEVVFTSYHGNGSLVTIHTTEGEIKKFDTDNNIVFTQPSFFKTFDRPIIMGKSNNLLAEPNEAVLSRKAALKLFNKEDALGEVLTFDGAEYKVAAIVEDFQNNTDLPFNIMLSYITIKKKKDEAGWTSIWSDEHCYFLLKEGESIEHVERRFPDFYKKHLGEKNDDNLQFHAQTLASIHHDERYGNYGYNTISYNQIAVMSIIGVFLIITACINFINLVTAEAIKRSKEVGIRKTMGSSRWQLIYQFMGESTLVTIISVVLAIIFASLALPALNTFLSKSLTINWLNAPVWLFLIGVTIGVALLSGIYPSLVVSAYKPAFALKNLINSKNSAGYNLRRGLVVVQFMISQFFLISAIIIIKQTDYFNKQDLGFSKEAIVNVRIPENERWGFADGTSKMRAFREEVTKMAGVQMASLCNYPPSSGSVNSTNFFIEGREADFNAQIKLIDGNYLDLYDLKLVAGNNVLDLDTAQGFLINEKLATMLGYQNPTDILGKQLKQGGRNFSLPVVGVIKNFHTMSLHEPIEPTVLYNRIRSYSTISLKVNPRQFPETVKEVQQKWESLYPDHIFSYGFLDEELREYYEGERRMSVLISVFTGIAIFIGCLGLFGLATFMANQKTKEVGVRKVLGASIESIVFLFSKEFIKLIVIGFVLAAPVVWYVMNQWLNGFSYKIQIGPIVFMVGFAVTFAIAMLTIGYRSFKAASVNPTHSLRSE